MRIAAGNWSSGSDRLDSAATATEAMDKTRLEMGLFQVTWSEYEGAVQYIRDRLREGSTEFDNVARALHMCADAYDTTDANIASNINQLQTGDVQ